MNQIRKAPERHTIRVGPAGWSYKDWEGTVYPPHGSRFDPLDDGFWGLAAASFLRKDL